MSDDIAALAMRGLYRRTARECGCTIEQVKEAERG
jgi:hypothetical protein